MIASTCQIIWPQALQTAQTLDPQKLPNRVTSLLPSTRHSILRNKRCAENASTWLRNVHTPFMGRVIGESTNADTPQEGHYRPDNGSGYRCITNVHTYSYHKSRSPIQCFALMRSAIMLKLSLVPSPTPSFSSLLSTVKREGLVHFLT